MHDKGFESRLRNNGRMGSSVRGSWKDPNKVDMNSCIHLGHFYSASLCPLYYSEALPTTPRILCRSFTRKRHRQLRVKDLPKFPTRRLERDFNPITLQTNDVESTNEPPHPTMLMLNFVKQ